MKKNRICQLTAIVLTLGAGVAWTAPSKNGVTSGMPFRRMMISQYGREIEVGSDKVRAYHVVDVDVPAGGRDAERISMFIGDLLVNPTNVTTTTPRVCDRKLLGNCDFGRAVGVCRKAFFDKSERMAFAGFAFIEGRTDISDDRYIGYSVHENSWCGNKTGGEYVTAFGVYSRQLDRRMVLSDFFTPDKIPQLNALIQEAYAERGPHASLRSFEEFRLKYPRDSDGMMVDPVANENFTITPHGLKWAYLDRDVVGVLSSAKEFPVEVEVPWLKLEPLLKDSSLMPKVRF